MVDLVYVSQRDTTARLSNACVLLPVCMWIYIYIYIYIYIERERERDVYIYIYIYISYISAYSFLCEAYRLCESHLSPAACIATLHRARNREARVCRSDVYCSVGQPRCRNGLRLPNARPSSERACAIDAPDLSYKEFTRLAETRLAQNSLTYLWTA